MSISSMAAVVVGTPAWVWLVLAFVIYRGFRATLPRRVRLWMPVVLPAIMMALSLGLGGPPASATAEIAWLAALAAGLAIGAALAVRTAISVEVGPPALLSLPGSWASLGIILSIFAVRYVSGALSAVDPAMAAAAGPALAGARGILSGIFLGRGLMLVARGWVLLRGAAAGEVA